VLIDTHCHLNLTEKFPDIDAVVRRAESAGVEKMMVVGLDVESSLRALELADAFDSVYAVVGWHPNSASSYTPRDIERIRELCEHPKAAAIGEIGYDNHWNFATLDQQDRCTRDQMQLAVEMKKPVVFHCREAYGTLFAMLDSIANLPEILMLHCFSGTESDFARGLEFGCYFGVDGPITYRKAERLRQIVSKMPEEKILIETDAPYLAPEPYRGRTNEPAFVRFVCTEIAQLRGETFDAMARVTSRNAMRAFRLG
jgi:TatD DNase family protein